MAHGAPGGGGAAAATPGHDTGATRRDFLMLATGTIGAFGAASSAGASAPATAPNATPPAASAKARRRRISRSRPILSRATPSSSSVRNRKRRRPDHERRAAIHESDRAMGRPSPADLHL